MAIEVSFGFLADDPEDQTILAEADFEDGTIGPFSHHGHSGRGLYEIIPDPTGSGRGNVLHLIYLDPATGSSDTESYILWSPPQDKPITYGDTVYSYGQFYIVPNGYSGNRKLWRYYVGPQGGPGSDITIWISNTLRVEGAGLYQNTQAPVTFGQWHTLEVQLTMNSAQGVQDGRFRVWLDGQQVFDQNFDPLRQGVGTLSSIRIGYQTQSTRDTVNLDDHRYWDNVVISTERYTPEPPSVQPFFEDDFESYDVGSTVSGGGNERFTWVGSRETWVSDLISHSGTRSLCFRYDDTPEDNHIWAEQRFSILGEPLKEVWIEYYLYYPDGTEGFGSVRMAHWDNPNASDNNKFYRLWGGGHPAYSGNPGKVGMSTRPRNGGPDGHIFFEYTKHGSSGTGPFDIGTNPNVWTWEDDLGRWIRVRMYYKHVSAPGAADAHFTLWKDDQVWIDAPNVDQAWVPEYPHWDSGYIFGADNSHIGTYAGGQILIFLDDYKMYDQDPGWTR